MFFVFCQPAVALVLGFIGVKIVAEFFGEKAIPMFCTRGFRWGLGETMVRGVN